MRTIRFPEVQLLVCPIYKYRRHLIDRPKSPPEAFVLILKMNSLKLLMFVSSGAGGALKQFLSFCAQVTATAIIENYVNFYYINIFFHIAGYNMTDEVTNRDTFRIKTILTDICFQTVYKNLRHYRIDKKK